MSRRRALNPPAPRPATPASQQRAYPRGARASALRFGRQAERVCRRMVWASMSLGVALVSAPVLMAVDLDDEGTASPTLTAGVGGRPFPPSDVGPYAPTVMPALAVADETFMTVSEEEDGEEGPARVPARRPVWPVEGPVPGCGTFGCPRPGHLHNGLDISAPEGVPVRAAAEGRVTVMEGTGASGGYGNHLCIQHRIQLATCYAHLSTFGEKMHVGELVARGQPIGEVGSTGYSHGPHLHFEVRRGPATCSTCAIDPQRWLTQVLAPGPVPARGAVGVPLVRALAARAQRPASEAPGPAADTTPLGPQAAPEKPAAAPEDGPGQLIEPPPVPTEPLAPSTPTRPVAPPRRVAPAPPPPPRVVAPPPPAPPPPPADAGTGGATPTG